MNDNGFNNSFGHPGQTPDPSASGWELPTAPAAENPGQMGDRLQPHDASYGGTPPNGREAYTPVGSDGWPVASVKRPIKLDVSLSWAAAMWKKHFGTLMLLATLPVGVTLIGNITNYAFFYVDITETAGRQPVPREIPAELAMALAVTIVTVLISGMLYYGLYRAVVDLTKGISPTFATAFTMDRFGTYIVSGILVTLALIAGLFLCVLPGIVAAFLLMFVPFIAVDGPSSATDVLRKSFDLARNNVGQAVLLVLLSFALGSVLGFASVVINTLFGSVPFIVQTGILLVPFQLLLVSFTSLLTGSMYGQSVRPLPDPATVYPGS